MKSAVGVSPVPHLDMLVAGRWTRSAAQLEIRNPLDRRRVATVSTGTPEDVRASIQAAAIALKNDFPAHARYEVLMRAANRHLAWYGPTCNILAERGDEYDSVRG